MRIVENSLGYFKYNILYHIKFESATFNLIEVELLNGLRCGF